MNQDQEHLKLLSIFHYVLGGLAGLFALFPIIHLLIGIVFLIAPDKMQGQGGPPPPAFVGWMFVLFALAGMLIGATIAALVVTTGRFLSRRRGYQFCVVIAALECLFVPLGTVLGVFTLVVLMRPSVRELFGANS